MKAIFINGSPRKGWNTHQMLEAAAEGARSVGAETEVIHLYDLNFTGCKSCFACKLVGSKTNGICAVRDDLRPVLEKIMDADVLVVGSPIYYSHLTGETLSFQERLIFPVMHYGADENGNIIRDLPKPKRCGLIATMNCPEQFMERHHCPELLEEFVGSLTWLLGDGSSKGEVVCACDTWQFTDYSMYDVPMFDVEKKAEQREKQFPIDLQNAFDMGKRLCEA